MTLNFNIWPTLLVHVCVNTHSHTQNTVVNQVRKILTIKSHICTHIQKHLGEKGEPSCDQKNWKMPNLRFGLLGPGAVYQHLLARP